MADNQVSFTILLKDLATRGLLGIKRASDETDKSLQHTEKSASLLSKSFSLIGWVGIAYGAYNAAKSILTLGTEMDAMRISFEVFSGSAEKANQHIADLRNLAASTPLEMPSLAEASKTMQQFGVSMESTMPILKALGDVSGGNAEKLQSLALVFGQVSAAQKLQGQDLLQFINAGWNPLLNISQRTGKSMAVLRDEMSKGMISSAMVSQALADATSEGGRFFGMMEKQSQTIAGRWSTLTDGIKEIAITIFEGGSGVLGEIITALANSVNWIKANLGAIANLFRPILQAMRPLYDVFDRLFNRLGGINERGGILVGVFELLGNVIRVIAPVLEMINRIVAPILEAVIMIVEGIFKAIDGLLKFLGIFKEFKGEDSAAQRKDTTQSLTDYLKTDSSKKMFGTSLTEQGESKLAKSTSAASKSSNQVKQINISIGKLVEGFTVQTTNLNQTAAVIKEEVAKALLSALNDANQIAGA